MAGGVHRERAAAVPAGDDRGGAGRQAGKVTERLRAGAPDMERPGADLIAHYLDPDRLPVAKRWSRLHADTQRRLCQRFAAPVIAGVTCQDITSITCSRSSAPRPPPARASGCTGAVGHGDRGHQGRYLTNPRLREVHWQAEAGPCPAAAQHVRGIGAVGRPGRDPRRRGYRQARPGAGRRAAG